MRTSPQSMYRSFETKAGSWDTCRESVRTSDLDNLLCLAFLPRDVQAACLAVRAFNVEVGSAADKARDPKMAEMRLMWWKQALESAVEGSPPAHPVADALCGAIRHFHLDPKLLEGLIEWRRRDLFAKQPETIDALELYAEGTQTAMFYLTLQALGEFGDQSAVKAASHVGQAVGLTLLLRGTIWHAMHNRCYLPKTVTNGNKLELSSLVKGEPSEALSQCVYEIAVEANRHLELAVEQNPSKMARKALMPAAVARIYLSQLEKSNYDIMSPKMRQMNPARIPLQLLLLKNSMLGRF